ncbi:RTA1-like protein [Cylindrobasidium torrendii FP15055 ss-10]|uniref:RTA1-like protein n=1 Tax=Cylindrobasidium torrendii FP15055 ss-10 TaxID=1314674 RepID=A0A0D7BTR4_9AGAR|nr:RTA1-like protein [Cylindrobasidium torrendii FP15055 ss-10]
MDPITFPELVTRVTKADASFYGYTPNFAACVAFLVLFSLSTTVHLIQALIYRRNTWWLIVTAVLAGILEILGWSARLWSHKNPGLAAPYEMQLTCTILAPTPLLAANFSSLRSGFKDAAFRHLIERLGPAYSRLSPKWYTALFCSCDIISLVVQAVGGGSAATGVARGTDVETGGHIMLGGIAFQLVVITVYAACATEFFARYFTDRPVSARTPQRGVFTNKLKILSASLAFSTLCLFVRAVYRTIELADGWRGKIIQTEVYFNVLDAIMVVLSLYTFNLVHPGPLLKNSDPDTLPKEEEKTGSLYA